MGVKLKELFESNSIKLSELSGKAIAVDAFNWIFQFLTTIRLADGSYLTDSKGRVTTHLNGLFYRSISLLENRIKPVFVFDGKAPKFKKETLLEREKTKEEAMEKMEHAATPEEKAMYMRRLSRIDDYIIDSSKELLLYLGIPYVQAPAEGEAQAARLNQQGKVFAAASQDYDTILFGAKKVVRNLNITNKRKINGKGITTSVSPEIIDSISNLSRLGITREQLITLSLFVGTDYNKGVEGIGPKKALKLVKDKSRDELFSAYDFRSDYDIKEIYEYFVSPNTVEIDKDLNPNRIEKEKLIKFLCEEHSFSEERVKQYIDKVKTEDNSLSLYG
ncbi:MAG: flap endonuclease-1 [Candidatus Parvarchaeota archaeon]|jgi:flap endonuclease-1|nr:flap endonuclease-1 [Candidatus Parvarchaeota archaeon]